MWIYLVIAMVIVPILVPLSIWKLEPTSQRRWVIAPLVGLGIGVATILLITMLRGPVSVSLGAHHLAYSIGLRNGILIIGLTCWRRVDRSSARATGTLRSSALPI